jgi:hypothetical protein
LCNGSQWIFLEESLKLLKFTESLPKQIAIDWLKTMGYNKRPEVKGQPALTGGRRLGDAISKGARQRYRIALAVTAQSYGMEPSFACWQVHCTIVE